MAALEREFIEKCHSPIAGPGDLPKDIPPHVRGEGLLRAISCGNWPIIHHIIEEGNFGIAPETIVGTLSMQSVIFASKSREYAERFSLLQK